MKTFRIAALSAMGLFLALPNAAFGETKSIFDCFEGAGFHSGVASRLLELMSNPDSFNHVQTRIDAGFEDGVYSGGHFLEMLYGGDDVTSGALSGRAIATIKVDGCEIGLFQPSAPR